MLTKEKLEHHIKHLEEKHDELESRLSNGQPDYIERILKKEKLQLKDEIKSCQEKIQSLK